MKRPDNHEFSLKISGLLKDIDSEKRNTCGPVLLNEVKRELIVLNEKIFIPRLHVSALDYSQIYDVVKSLCRIMPEYLSDHSLLENQKPPVESHYLQFVREIKGKNFNFIHMFKIDLGYSSGIGKQREPGDTEYYASFDAENLVSASQIIPVENIDYSGGVIRDFSPLRIIKKEKINGDDTRIMVHTFFDDFDPAEINESIWSLIDQDIFPFTAKIFPFVSYSYFSSCLNIPDPKPEFVLKAALLYEVMLVKILYRFAVLTDAETYRSDYLILRDGKPEYTEKYADEAKKLFSRYSVYQDEELMMKRWRKLNVAG